VRSIDSLREANTRNKTLKEPLTQRSKHVLKQASGEANTRRSKHQEKQTHRAAKTRRSKHCENQALRKAKGDKQACTEVSIEISKH
jgi:hypothetical protein